MNEEGNFWNRNGTVQGFSSMMPILSDLRSLSDPHNKNGMGRLGSIWNVVKSFLAF